TVLAPRGAFAPDAQEPGRIVTAVPDPPAPEIYAALHHQASHLRRQNGQFAQELFLQRPANPFIGIQSHHPVALLRQIVDRPIQLPRMRLERMKDDLATAFAGYVAGTIGASGVDDEDARACSLQAV